MRMRDVRSEIALRKEILQRNGMWNPGSQSIQEQTQDKGRIPFKGIPFVALKYENPCPAPSE